MEQDRENIFRDKKVLIVGLARSGTGAANLLCSLGAHVSVTDISSRDALEDNIRKLLPSIKLIAGEHPQEVFDSADLIVVSPGVPLDIPPLKHAHAKGVPVIGELELAYQTISTMTGSPEVSRERVSARRQRLRTPHFIGITGTNGKSTTTTLVDMMLKKAGFHTLMGGNIGSALTEGLNELRARRAERALDYVVAEVSSFQLESIQHFKPSIAVVLNITADHLNRYENFEDYVRAKAHIFKNQRADDYLILNADDPEVMRLYDSHMGRRDSQLKNVHTLFFSRKKMVEGISCINSCLFLNLLSTPGTALSGYFQKGPVPPFKLISLDEIRIKGVHNLENAMASALAALISGCSLDDIRSVLKDFPGLEHRLEFIDEIDGVKFVNDSKGTNVGAVMKSIESFDNIVLIMGGRDKNGDFTVLRDMVSRKVKYLMLLGEAKEKIAKAMEGVAEIIYVKDMREAVQASLSVASAGDVVLLSPGCASFDMYRDFEQRGKNFREEVKEIRKRQCG